MHRQTVTDASREPALRLALRNFTTIILQLEKIICAYTACKLSKPCPPLMDVLQ